MQLPALGLSQHSLLRYLRLLLCSTVLWMMGMTINTAAQETSGGQSGTGNDSNTLEEVVATGTRMRGAEAPVGSDLISLDRQTAAGNTSNFQFGCFGVVAWTARR